MKEHMRTIKLTPYRDGMGPQFTLSIFDTGRRDNRGQTTIAYDLVQLGQTGESDETIFEGSDFNGSPMDADDSADTLANLLGFLTLRPGDTDPEYFEDYTDRQLEFCDDHAETLGMFAEEGMLARCLWDPDADADDHPDQCGICGDNSDRCAFETACSCWRGVPCDPVDGMAEDISDSIGDSIGDGIGDSIGSVASDR